jgi:hypothetical protein
MVTFSSNSFPSAQLTAVKIRYGGTLLGPARFSHIETCSREVCRLFKRQDELDDCLSTLASLDDILSHLRVELARLIETTSTPDPAVVTAKKTPYPSEPTDVNIAKLKRLIGAREKSISAVKALLAQRQTSPQPESSTPARAP